MIVLENGKYVVKLPEHFLHQDVNPDNGGAPFASEAEAQAWEDAYLALAAQSATAAQAAEQAASAQRLSDEKSARVKRIKEEAAERIGSLDWKIQRANEHIALGIAGAQAELTAVYQAREDIRVASTAAESAVAALVSSEEVRALAW